MKHVSLVADAAVMHAVPSYIGVHSILTLRALARAYNRDAWPCWLELRITANETLDFSYTIHRRRRHSSDCTLRCWNAMPLHLRQSICGHVKKLTLHMRSPLRMMEEWRLARAEEFCQLESVALLSVASYQDDDSFVTHDDVVQYTAKLMAFFLSLPPSLRYLNICIDLFPDTSFRMAEVSVISAVLAIRKPYLQGLSADRVDQFQQLEPEQASQIRILSCTTQLDTAEMKSFFDTIRMCSMLERLNLTVLVDDWADFYAHFTGSIRTSALEVLMFGLENFDQLPSDTLATQLAEITPQTVQMLFLRLYPQYPERFLESLETKLRSRNCSPWVFVDVSDIAWVCPDIDVFAPSLDRRLWNEPEHLLRSICWRAVQSRLQHGIGWSLAPIRHMKV